MPSRSGDDGEISRPCHYLPQKVQIKCQSTFIFKPTKNVVVGWWEWDCYYFGSRSFIKHRFPCEKIQISSCAVTRIFNRMLMPETEGKNSMQLMMVIGSSAKYVLAHPIKSGGAGSDGASLPRNRLLSIRKWALIKLPSIPSNGHYRYDATWDLLGRPSISNCDVMWPMDNDDDEERNYGKRTIRWMLTCSELYYYWSYDLGEPFIPAQVNWDELRDG